MQLLRLRLPLLVLLLVGAYLVAIAPSSATLLSGGSIEYCTDDGTEPPNCSRKYVCALTVGAGEVNGAEDVVYTVENATDKTAGYTSASAPPVRFNPITLSVSRSVVRYRYPLYYAANFNAKPYEATIKGSLLHECNAEFDLKATCGLVADDENKLIPFSQGFCCSCSVCQAAQLCPTDARGACNVLGEFTAASCLRFGEDWYAGFRIGEPTVDYQLNVTLTTTKRSADGKRERVTRVLQLGPSIRGASNSELGVVASIAGGFASVVRAPVLSPLMLFMPSLPLGSPRVVAGSKEYLLLDKSRVTFDGSECNKVGVSYEAFATQGNACAVPHGTCLSSQLEDMRAMDMAAVAAGGRPEYMVSNFGDYAVEAEDATGAVTLVYTAAAGEVGDVALAVELNADQLEYVLAVAAGNIVSAAVTPQPLVAMAEGGVMTLAVENVGSLNATFALSVSCGPDVFPIPESPLWLVPGKLHQHNVSLLVQNPKLSGELSCHVVLRDSQEAEVDSRDVSLSVAQADFKNSTNDSDNRHPADSTEHDESDHARCEACGETDFACMIDRRCWPILARWSVVAFVLLLAACIAYKLLPRCLSWRCCETERSDSRPSTDRRRRHNESEPFEATEVRMRA